MIYIKHSTVSSLPKAKLLYIMGATWHNQCMFDLDIDDNFSTILNNYNIETYAFNIIGAGPHPKTELISNQHNNNVKLAKEIVEKYNIDFVMGYSYGCKVIADLVNVTSVKGVLLLDPATKIEIKTSLIDNDDKILISKDAIRESMAQYQVTIDDRTLEKHFRALCNEDSIVTAAYPKLPRNGSMALVPGLPRRVFFTKNSNPEYRAKFPERIIKYYPNASHWILLEEYRKELAADVNNFISSVNK